MKRIFVAAAAAFALSAAALVPSAGAASRPAVEHYFFDGGTTTETGPTSFIETWTVYSGRSAANHGSTILGFAALKCENVTDAGVGECAAGLVVTHTVATHNYTGSAWFGRQVTNLNGQPVVMTGLVGSDWSQLFTHAVIKVFPLGTGLGNTLSAELTLSQ